MEENNNEEYQNIRLDSIPYLLNDRGLTILKDMGVNTVGELFAVSEDKDFDEALLKKSISSYQEIFGVIRLLKCKYLGIDPLFDYNYDSDYFDNNHALVKYGFSIKAYNKLARGGITPKKIFEIVTDKYGIQELLKVRNVGDSIAREVLYKGAILVDFYNKKNGVLKSGNDEDILILLENEVQEIQKEIQKLNNRTKTVLAMIQERVRKNEGGITK